nr:DNAse I-like superfamily protein [Tanacetum cinerariifolium]
MEMEPDIENMMMNEYLKDTFDIWDITDEDVEQIRQFFTPNVPDVIENVIQPLIPKTLHTTPPNVDYVALTTKSILDDLLEEFEDEILNVTMVDKRAKCNPAKDIEELERLLAKEPQLQGFTLRDYYCWLKTYFCWYKLMLLDNAADIKLRLLEQSAAVDRT